MLITTKTASLRQCLVLSVMLFLTTGTYAQFTPVTVTGFNHDVIAETGTSSLTTTTIACDAVPASNRVMYTAAFRTANSFGGGGLPDNGTITDAAGSYQMAAFNSNNVLLLQRNQNGDLNLSTPAKFNKIRILCNSTEGTSLINATLFFTDGSSTVALTNYSLGDWFNNSTNLVISGFGRCTRATPASGADGYNTNPRMYYMEITLSCTDKQKTLQKINLANVTTGGSNAPYPNAQFFAVSGTAYSQNITSSAVSAVCGNNGSATVTPTGSASPFSVSWNTTPVQTGNTASNLGPGTYQATVTDANGCITTVPVTVTGTGPVSLTLHADTSICPGASFNANTTSNGTTFAWTPTAGVSNPAIASPVLSPASTTTYSVTASTGQCITTKTFTVTVLPAVTLTLRADTSICTGASINANGASNATTILWSPATGVSNASIANPVLSPTSNTSYTVTATTGNCSVSKTLNITVNPLPSVSAGNNASIFLGNSTQLQGTGSAGTYLWTPSAGLSATNILNPTASPQATTTYTLKVTSPQGCTKTADVVITVIVYCIKPMEAFTPNGDGFNDKWLVTTGNCLKYAWAQVFNRYGSRVFESKDYKNDWDGTYKGKPLPDGTYYYVIKFELINGSVTELKGNVSILR